MTPVRLLSALVALVFLSLPAGAQQPAVPGLDIHYVPTPEDVVEAMLTLAKVQPGDVVIDLGSGDGRIPIEAARKYGARGIGVELDPALVERARDNAKAAGVADRVTFTQADLFRTDLSDADVVTLYLSPSINLRLRAKLQRELKPGARVVSHRFPIGDWAPDQDLMVGSNRVMFWLIR
jgi:precorrin-6B methylase 2